LARRIPARTRSTIKFRTSGVQLLAKTDEFDVQAVELIEYFEKVPDGSSKAVAGPDQYDVKLSSPRIRQHLIQPGTPRPGAADSVCIALDNFEFPLPRHLLKIVELGFRMLVER
jgi:hypothetical protein